MSLNSLDPKDPNDVKDYVVDWDRYLAGLEGGPDTIATSTWPSPPTGINVVSDSFSGNRARVWLSGGTAGTTYSLTNRITTTGGRTLDRTIEILVKEL